MTKPIVRSHETTPTPLELAECFWSMDSGDQAIFFNHLGSIAGAKLCFQLSYVASNENLLSVGQECMREIGCYG